MESTFGQILKELRRSKGISQRDLAELVGVDFSYISKIENDRLPPPAATTVEKICEVLKIPSENLLSYSGKMGSGIKDIIISSTEAMKFMNEAKRMNLTDEDWKSLTQKMKRLK
jgi:transcriptional regulator with XRE-family HTH domain